MSGERKIIRLVPLRVSQDAVAAAEALLARVRSGETVGFAWVEMHKMYYWTVDAAGECRRIPTITRGHVAVLDDQLAGLADNL